MTKTLAYMMIVYILKKILFLSRILLVFVKFASSVIILWCFLVLLCLLFLNLFKHLNIFPTGLFS